MTAAMAPPAMRKVVETTPRAKRTTAKQSGATRAAAARRRLGVRGVAPGGVPATGRDRENSPGGLVGGLLSLGGAAGPPIRFGASALPVRSVPGS